MITSQTQAAIDPALVARVRKLLNLSKDGAASENEQEIAAQHAQRLMLEHNISVATVEASHDTSTIVRRKKEKQKGTAMYAWQQNLMSAVATSNFTFVTVNQDWNGYRWMPKGYDLVGREENIVGTQIMFEYLRATIERLAQDYVGGDYRAKMSTEAMSFKAGCAERVPDRVIQRHRQALADQRAAAEAARAGAPTGTALAVIMEDYAEAERCANEDFRLDLPAGTTARRKVVAKTSSNAYRAVLDALRPLGESKDAALLTQVATAAVAELGLEALALTDAERESLMDYAVHSTVNSRVNPSKPSRRGGWGRSSASTKINYTAHDAGRRAGNSVGLDKQVGGRATPKQIG
jgi:hypothetical protein